MRARWIALLGALVLSLSVSGSAQAATDPLFVFTPEPPPPSIPPQPPVPPPTGYLFGPCGLAVSLSGSLYVSDYHHNVVDVFNSAPAFTGQLGGVDPLDGPCGLALNGPGQLFVSNYHRNITRYEPSPGFGSGTLFPLPAEETDKHLPTGVAVGGASVYVNHRTYVGKYDFDGALQEKIGEGTLEDGYGVAFSQFPATVGRIYVPDAATNTVKAYNPAVSATTPVATLELPSAKPFLSLRDSSIAVDRVNGDIYVADNNQPEYTERPQATIHVFGSTNSYKGHLKYNVITALPAGLAVDNSALPTQGRVYVTSGNSSPASIYAYGPGSATSAAPLPPLGSGLQPPGSSSGTGAGASLRQASEQAFGPGKDAPAASTSVITQKENLRVSVEGKISPKKLPREGKAPVSVEVGWEIATTDGSSPPKLRKLRVEINKEGHFETKGLPTCPPAKIQPATTKRALSNCRSALVGQGNFSARIALRGQEGESYEAGGRLLLFNGEEKGKPVIYGQIYSPRPFATSFLITFTVKTIKKGAYGTVLEATLPASLRSWGDLTGIQMRLSRKYGFAGKSRSYVSAGCPAPKGFKLASFELARTSFDFTDGKQVSSTVSGYCQAR